jgi:putative acetyltransferase
MRITEASIVDLPAVLEVERAAFAGDEEVVTLVSDLMEDPTALPLLSLVAWDGDEAIGHALFTAVSVVGSLGDLTASILAPLAVVPAHQRAGVGALLIETGADMLTAARIDLVFVLGHPSYYTRHGFEPAFPRELAAPYPISPEEAWMVRELKAGVLGSVRGTVFCAEAMMKPEYWRE